MLFHKAFRLAGRILGSAIVIAILPSACMVGISGIEAHSADIQINIGGQPMGIFPPPPNNPAIRPHPGNWRPGNSRPSWKPAPPPRPHYWVYPNGQPSFGRNLAPGPWSPGQMR